MSENIDDWQQELSERIRQAFGNMRVKDMAAMANMSEQQMNRILNGDNFSVGFLFKIISALPNISLDWLVLGMGEMYKEQSAVDLSKQLQEMSLLKKQVNDLQSALGIAQLEYYNAVKSKSELEKRMDRMLEKYESTLKINEMLEQQNESLLADKEFVISQVRTLQESIELIKQNNKIQK
jgi:hypothetical protein